MNVDTQTGDLTIRNLRMKYSGIYEAEINNPQTSYKRFNVTIKESPRGIDEGIQRSVSLTLGDSVTLHIDFKIQRGDLIQWRFGDQRVLIAESDMEDNMTLKYPEVFDGRFKDRLKLDDQTGNLTITNARIEDTGIYVLKIITNIETKYETFSVSVSLSAVAKGFIVFFSMLAVAVAGFGMLKLHRWMAKKKQKKLTEEIKEPVGETVFLHSDIDIKLQRGDQIECKFNDRVIMTGEKTEDTEINVTYRNEDQFKNRLEVSYYNGSLIINDILKEDSGLYERKITNNNKTSLNKIHLNVTDKMMSVSEGNPVLLRGAKRVLQTGAQIEWKFKDRVIITGEKTEDKEILVTASVDQQFKDRLKLGDHLGYLIIKNVSKKDTGLYEVNITKDKQPLHLKFHVIVTDGSPKEDLNEQTGDELRLVPEEEILTLVGSHIGTQTGTQIEWKFNDRVIMTGEMTEDEGITEIHSDGQKFKGRLKLNPYFGHLIINNISKEDTGLYKVNITNNTIMLSSRFKVKVIDKALQHLPVDVQVSEGDRVTLPGAYSRPGRGSQIEWTFKGRVIMTGEMTMKGMTGIHSDDQQFKDRLGLDYNFGSLFIKNISKKDAGLYEGKITNVTKPLHFKIKVNVIDKIMSVAEGDSLILPGTQNKLLIGTKIEWKFNNRVITTGNMTQDAGIIKINGVHQQFNGRLKQDPFRGSLTINNISKEDIGLYEVNITNKNETSHNRFHVDVIDSPRTNKNEPEPTTDSPRTNKNEPEPTAGMALLSV